VGTPQYSDYPAAARSVPRIGDAFRFDMERVLASHPDVVLAWEPGTPEAVIGRLRGLRLRVEKLSTGNIAGIAQAVRQIGKIAGTEAVANEAAGKFESDIEALRRRYSRQAPVSVFLQINDRPLYTVSGKQIMSEVLGLCGGRNVFAALNDLAPQVGIEAVIVTNPEVIISTGDAQAEALEQWRRWPQMTAVATGNIYVLSPDNIERATTRLAEGAAEICRVLETARQRLGRSSH
jgi:iron complex transport system substrate-binding protein